MPIDAVGATPIVKQPVRQQAAAPISKPVAGAPPGDRYVKVVPKPEAVPAPAQAGVFSRIAHGAAVIAGGAAVLCGVGLDAVGVAACMGNPGVAAAALICGSLLEFGGFFVAKWGITGKFGFDDPAPSK